MKITILLYTSPRMAGGGTKVLYEYANYMVWRGHTVEFAFLANSIWSRFGLPEFIQKPLALCSIRHRPKWFHLDHRIIKYGIFEINDETVHDADVIIISDVRTATPVSKLSASKGEKIYIIQDFENWVLPDEEVIATYSLDFHHLTVAKSLSEMVDAHSSHPSICIPNGINTDLFRVTAPIKSRRPHTIAFHYRSNEMKGAKYALETIRILEKKYIDLEVFVVSTEKPPVDLPKCCKYIYRATPEKVAKINNEVSIFMCSTIFEGFGLPGLEAMACGCALVSTDYPGVHEYAENEVNALLSPVRDPELMAKNIIRLFENDDLRKRLALAGAYAGEKRSTKISAQKFENAINKFFRTNKER